MAKHEEWFEELPIFPSRTTVSVCEGDAEFFRDGLVRLGAKVFSCHTKFELHRFSGCEARRGEDCDLVIVTPLGEEFRYRYDKGKEAWYRKVVTVAPKGLLAIWNAEYHESIQRNGRLFGSICYGIHFLWWKVLFYTVFVTVLLGITTILAAPFTLEGNIHTVVGGGTALLWLSWAVSAAREYARAMHRCGIDGLLFAIQSATIELWPAYVWIALTWGITLLVNHMPVHQSF